MHQARTVALLRGGPSVAPKLDLAVVRQPAAGRGLPGDAL